jgi:hypothetical protein
MAALNATPYDIARPTGRCAITGAEIAPGAPIVVLLAERDDLPGELLERLDILADAWTPDARRRLLGSNRRLFALWRCAQPEPSARPRLFIDDEGLVEIFHNLGDEIADPPASDDDRANVAFRFVLALILCRKRLLRHEGSRPPAGKRPALMLVRPKGAAPEEPPIEVIDPGMDRDALSRATERLAQVMRGDA